VSPGLGIPLPSASIARVADFVALRIGAAVTPVTVGSPGAGVDGSSVGTGGSSFDVTWP